MKEQDFTQSLFILILISDGEGEIEQHKIEKISKHLSEDNTRNSMKPKKIGYYIIICVSSNGAPENASSVPAHKTASDGHVKGTIIHADKGLDGIASDLLATITKSHGNEVRNAANEARRLASEKRHVLNLGG